MIMAIAVSHLMKLSTTDIDYCTVCSWLLCISLVVEWLVTTASHTLQPFLVLLR